MKTCPKCHVEKQLTAFSRDKSTKDGLNRRCRECHNAATRRIAQTPEGRATKRRWQNRGTWPSQIFKKYGLTLEAYAWLLHEQDFRCAICEREFPNDIVYGRTAKLGPCVDHDHTTGAIRGLLCGECNYRLLGEIERDPYRTVRALKYLGWEPHAPHPLRKMA